jgi:hypothetical protein
MHTVTFLFRILVGVVALFVAWFVLDKIHDRNTEIIVSVIGMLYSFIYVISRRLQYFGLTVFSIFGITLSYVQKIPYDRLLRDEAGVHKTGEYSFVSLIFSALIELLCVFRLFTSLLGHGWDALSAPVHSILEVAHIQPFLNAL